MTTPGNAAGAAAEPARSFSQVRAAGGLLFVSSEVAHQASGQAPAGIQAQTHLVLQHLQATLARHQARLADVVQVTVHLRHAEDFAAFCDVYRGFFTAPYPARTTVIAGSLYPGAVVELTVVAQAPAAGGGA